MNQSGPAGEREWPRPQAVYVHIPFCRHRCGYCNFSVVAGRDDLVDRMLGAIDAELAALERPLVDTLFVGGGTPTHLTPQQLERLLQSLQDRLQLREDFEWSAEANPEDITLEKLQVLSGFGVNRISLGVQSFQLPKLMLLERGHEAAAAIRAVELAAAVIPNLSLDLIFATPGETVGAWEEDLRTALSLPIQHLSTYTLTFEKGTSFWARREKGSLAAVPEEDELEMYVLARAMTQAAGLGHYEVSNFARPGHRCRHNLAYWRGSGWFAAGPGAARFVAGRREVNHRSPTTYLRRSERGQSVVAESEVISREQYGREVAAFGVRLIDGLDTVETFARTGVDVRRLCHRAISRTVELGLLSDDPPHLRLSERGLLFADSVASEFLSDG